MLLRKKIYQFGLMALIFACGSLFVASAALAEDWPASQDPNELIVEFEQTPLFGKVGNEEGNFMPGDSVARWVKVTNNTDSATETKRIATQAIKFGGPSYNSSNPDDVPNYDLSRALLVTIREKNNGTYTDIYGAGDTKTLFQFYENGETYLSSVSGGGGIVEYEFEISFPADKGDYWQGATTKFDIVVGFQGEDGGIVPGTNPGGSGGGLLPGLTILDESVKVKADTTSVVITWTTSYFSTSQVIYSSKAEYEGTCTTCSGTEYKFNLTKPKYGYFSAFPNPEDSTKVTGHSVTITGLSPSTTYYYRAVSHASPPTISREYSFTTFALADGDDEHTPSPSPRKDEAEQEGDNGGVSGIYPRIRGAAGAVSNFIGSLFGNETENVEGRVAGAEESKNADEGEADENKTDIAKSVAEAGSETAGECGKYPAYLLWLIISLLLVIAALLYHILRKRKEGKNIELK